MNLQLTITLLFLSGFLGSATASQNDEKFLNGKPFAKVNEAIQTNADAIAANAEGIENNANSIDLIEGEIITLKTSLNLINTEMVTLQNQVNANLGSINELLANDEQLSSAIAANSNLLSDLRNRHNQDVADINEKMGVLEGDIIALQQYINTQILAVNLVITELQASQSGVDEVQDAAILDLQSKSLGLMSSILTLNASLSSQASSLAFLEARMNNADAQINELGLRVTKLESDVATLNCLPDHPDYPCEVKITSLGEAYGHHGSCDFSWNGCTDAATCAQWACEVNGYAEVSRWGEDKPCTEFDNCHLFWSQGSIQWNWGNWCDVQGVTDIYCKE
ncbi:chromosome segregation ATPase [Vibrio sp. EJY3]|uniref:chromosome segregation ATPase n=1 Tax=Vibrio sp. (strain EJY3) TaxID=1116375 RepID=UPI000243BED1|nr:chromosome segregation ATPase [Vibrio sp. EJY3]AEX22840.1 chromosome segregation ATPase [Vibrio sp. EJY3]